jgi:hypothetical protein
MSLYDELVNWVEARPMERSMTLTTGRSSKGVSMKLMVLTEDHVRVKVALSSEDRTAMPRIKEEMARKIMKTLRL